MELLNNYHQNTKIRNDTLHNHERLGMRNVI